MRRIPLLVAMSAALASITCFASDVEVTPAPGGAFIIKDESLNERFRVLDSGEVYIPGVTSTPLNSALLCFSSPTGQVTQCDPSALDGAQGPVGATGEQGPVGDKGAVGDKGPQGDAGDQGPIGTTGAPGPVGDKGAVGDKGPQGDAGAQGPVGTTGDQGPVGNQGAEGNQGATGATGAPGPVGDKGALGDKGPQGDAGDQGPVGTTGAPGPVGDKGALGDKGPQGDAGPQGPDGDTASMNLTEITQVCTDQNLSNSGGLLTCQVSCPAGYVVMTGGFECALTGSPGGDPTDPNCDAELLVKQSRPLSLGSGWVATWRNIGATSISAEVITYAYCAVIDGCSPANLSACTPPPPPAPP